MKRERYTDPIELENDLTILDTKIKDIQEGNENIIKHSVVDDTDQFIEKINNKVKATKSVARRRTCIRNIKIVGDIVRIVAPYIIVPALIFGIITPIAGMPFASKEGIHYANHEMVMDSAGTREDKIDYKDYRGGSSCQVYVVHKWEQKKDGRYYQKTQEYKVSETTLKDIQKLYNKENITREDVFGEAKEPTYEVKDEITEEELNKGDYIKICYSYCDEEDYMMLPLPFDENGSNVLFIIGTFMGLFFTFAAQTFGDVFSDRFNHIAELKNNYKNPDMKYVMAQFREKSKAFKQMKKNNFEPILEVERNFQKKKAMK